MNELEKAISSQDATLLKAILPKVKIDTPLKNGWTALMLACHLGDLEKVNILLNFGADPCFVSSLTLETPFTAVTMASDISDDTCADIIGALLRRVPPEKRVSLINARERSGLTPLMLAAKTRKPNSLKLLIKFGARVQEIDSRGRSALYYAVLARNLTICRILMEAGADPNQVTSDGQSALTRAETMGAQLLCEILLKTQRPRRA